MTWHAISKPRPMITAHERNDRMREERDDQGLIDRLAMHLCKTYTIVTYYMIPTCLSGQLQASLLSNPTSNSSNKLPTRRRKYISVVLFRF